MYVCLSVCLSVCWSSLHGPISYSLLGGGITIPERQICGTLDSVTLFSLLSPRQTMVLPSIDLHIASIVSMYQSPWRVILVNTRSFLYLLLSRRMALRRNFCVSSLMCWRQLKYWFPNIHLDLERWHPSVYQKFEMCAWLAHMTSLGQYWVFPTQVSLVKIFYCSFGQW